MSTSGRPKTLSMATAGIPWMLNLATRLVASMLNMPEPMVHDTGDIVFVHVRAVEISIGNRVMRQLRTVRRSACQAAKHAGPRWRAPSPSRPTSC